MGPIRNETGWYILKVDAIQPKHANSTLRDMLTTSGVSDADYREFVRQELLRDQFQQYFETKVVTLFEPQRKVSQIVITRDAAGSPGTKIRLRHILVAPIPGATDQSKATPKQWRAALAKAKSCGPRSSSRAPIGGSSPSRATILAAPSAAGHWAGPTRGP